MKPIRKRLTYANVVSSLALFLALTGATAFAANQLAKNSVGSKQLKKNAVTTAKIKNEAVTAGKIKNGGHQHRLSNGTSRLKAGRRCRDHGQARGDDAATTGQAGEHRGDRRDRHERDNSASAPTPTANPTASRRGSGIGEVDGRVSRQAGSRALTSATRAPAIYCIDVSVPAPRSVR